MRHPEPETQLEREKWDSRNQRSVIIQTLEENSVLNTKVGKEEDMGTLSFLGGNVGAVLASRTDVSVMTRIHLQWGDQLPTR
jgi:hypothetical protein